MSSEMVKCQNCGKMTIRKKRCMYCYAILPEEEQAMLGGSGKPYWAKEEGET